MWAHISERCYGRRIRIWATAPHSRKQCPTRRHLSQGMYFPATSPPARFSHIYAQRIPILLKAQRCPSPRATIVFRGARASSIRLGMELPRDARHLPPYGWRCGVLAAVLRRTHTLEACAVPHLSDFFIEMSYLTFAYEFRLHTST